MPASVDLVFGCQKTGVDRRWGHVACHSRDTRRNRSDPAYPRLNSIDSFTCSTGCGSRVLRSPYAKASAKRAKPSRTSRGNPGFMAAEDAISRAPAPEPRCARDCTMSTKQSTR